MTTEVRKAAVHFHVATSNMLLVLRFLQNYQLNFRFEIQQMLSLSITKILKLWIPRA